jgi:hypothetical protein
LPGVELFLGHRVDRMILRNILDQLLVGQWYHFFSFFLLFFFGWRLCTCRWIILILGIFIGACTLIFGILNLIFDFALE